MDLGRQSPLGSACHPTAFCIKGDFLLCLFTPLNFFQVKPGEFFQVFTFLEGGEGAEPSPRSVLQPRGNTKISFTPRPPLAISLLGDGHVALQDRPPPGSAGTLSLVTGSGPYTMEGCWVRLALPIHVLVPPGPGPGVSDPPTPSRSLTWKQRRFQGALRVDRRARTWSRAGQVKLAGKVTHSVTRWYI